MCCGVAVADFDAQVSGLIQYSEAVLVGDVIAKKYHGSGIDSRAVRFNPRALVGRGGGELHQVFAGGNEVVAGVDF